MVGADAAVMKRQLRAFGADETAEDGDMVSYLTEAWAQGDGEALTDLLEGVLPPGVPASDLSAQLMKLSSLGEETDTQEGNRPAEAISLGAVIVTQDRKPGQDSVEDMSAKVAAKKQKKRERKKHGVKKAKWTEEEQAIDPDADDLFAQHGSSAVAYGFKGVGTATVAADAMLDSVYLSGVRLAVGGQELLLNADLRLFNGHRYGMVGNNGVGKSQLLARIASKRIQNFPTHMRVVYIDQEAVGSPTPVWQAVMESDTEVGELQAREAELMASDGPDVVSQLEAIQVRLAEKEDAEGRARKALLALGFTSSQMELPTLSLSGGWRMRVALAQALFMKPNLLLMDEPTNHLDMEGVIWLQNALTSHFKGILLVISHDRAFLNAVATDIVHFDQQNLRYYEGNYDLFEKTMQDEITHENQQAEFLEKKRKAMEQTIINMRAKLAKNPDLSTGMISSRLHKLAMLGKEKTADGRKWKLSYRGERVQAAPPPPPPSVRFEIPPAATLTSGGAMLQLDQVSFRYPGQNDDQVHNVTLDIAPGDRIALLGPNGTGKSTVLKLLKGEVEPTSGKVVRNHNLRVAHFAQHHQEQLDLNMSAVEFLSLKAPQMSALELRSRLGKVGLKGETALQKMESLSGGQKSRVTLAYITFDDPQLLLLDEPTNHLDVYSVQALLDALRAWRGAVVVVSHDQWFVGELAKQYYVVGDHRVRIWAEDLEDYVARVAAGEPIFEEGK